MSPAASRALTDLLAARTGQCLPESRRWRLPTALSALFREHGIAGVDALAARLARPGETALATQVIDALLNNETYFFRDRTMFDVLSGKILGELAEHRADQRRLSVWTIGCSTGQETLSLAMLFAGDPRWAGWRIDILATDVSTAAIETARKGCYSQFEIQRGLRIGEMVRWFEEVPQGWQASPHLLQMIRYDVRNLFDPLPGATRFDLILCRNVLLYFDAKNRARAFERMAGSLASDGWLMLGAGETVMGQTDLLAAAPGMPGICRPTTPKSVSRFSPAQRARG